MSKAPATRRWRVLLAAYAAFVVYGSFFPFQFTAEPAMIQRGLARAIVRPFDESGRRLVSIPDVLSNVMLGVPVGVLLVAGRLAGRSLVVACVTATAVELAFASAVELGQIFAPSRTASAVDVLAQVVGALGGAVLAWVGLGILGTPRARRALEEIARRPPLIVALILAAILAADALYPYAVTLDVSTAWGNLKRAQLVPLGGLRGRFWPDLLVEKVLPYTALAAAARLVMLRAPAGAAATLAFALATALAVGLEAGKLGIVGRAPSVDNVLLALAGALVGVAIAPATQRRWVRANAPALLVAAAAALLVYEQLSPFDFVGSLATVSRKAARIEWLPLGAYYGADTRSALFDLGKKLVLGGFLGIALALARCRRPWAWAFALGALTEAAQLAQFARVVAVTDVISVGAGAALGTALIRRGAAPPVSISGH